MGMVTWVNRETGEKVHADFPLHPMLVNATRPDGTGLQVMRDDWDRTYVQQLPELPAVDFAGITDNETTPYEAPNLIRLVRPDPVPNSHQSWFVLLYDEMIAIERKIEVVLRELAKPAAEVTPPAAVEVTPPAPPAAVEVTPPDPVPDPAAT